MILFTNGCSWTYGGSLNLDDIDQTEQRLQSVYPHYLSRFLKAEKTVNISRGCGSNQRILRTTFDWLSQQSREDLDKTLAIIQWTDPSRYEFYYPKDFNDKFENSYHRWMQVKTDILSHEYNFPTDHNESAYDFQELFFKKSQVKFELWSQQEEWYNTINYWSAMDNIFKTFRVKYYYWYPFNNIFNTYPENIKNYLNDNFSNLEPVTDRSHIEYDRIAIWDSHPSFEGHKQIAAQIYNLLRTKHQF